MIRNEYRRAFIMLRAARQGYGGHVRLERRTLTGNLYFIVSAPEETGPLRAALVGQRDGQYYAASLGDLARDRRGQFTLAYAFDPRSIDGRPLEAYAWVAVADAGGRCAVVLTGNVEGSRQVSPEALERAVCALLAPDPEPAADLPAPDEPPVAAPIRNAPDGSEAPSADREDGVDPPEDVKIYTGSRARIFTPTPATAPQPADDAQAKSSPASGEDASPVSPSAPTREVSASESAAPAETGAEAASPSGDPPTEATAAAIAMEATQTAARALGLNITQPWPPAIESLRRLFATQAPLESAPDGEHVYISAPLPPSSGYGACLIGLKAEDGRATGLRYALPARYAPLPPAGLEGYRWLGDSGEGFWILDVAVE